MITCSTVTKRSIRNHYEIATLFYRLLWGAHIHHGLWHADESPSLAQRQLIDHLVDQALLPRGAEVLDVGCGMGGSSIYLARRRGCSVTGLTLSRLQQTWAVANSVLRGVRSRTRFLRGDAETAQFASGQFDFLWSVECTEHLFEKAWFFQRASQWLRPGGGVALCAWLAADEPHSPAIRREVHRVCEAFLCPSLGTAEDYLHWLNQAGLTQCRAVDLTDKITRTWEICMARVRRLGIGTVSRLAGPNMARFCDNFGVILHAYRSGAMKYASITAHKPAS